MSGFGRITEETCHVRNVAEVAIAKMKSAYDEVKSKVASLATQTEASTAHTVGVLSECVKAVAENSES